MTKEFRVTPEVTEEFFDREITSWPLAAKNYLKLDDALYAQEEILFKKRFWIVTKILIDYRKGSVTADIGAAMNGSRRCFLCDDSRPAEQTFIPWKDYKILVNPYPLGIPHYTIAHNEHVPQRIAGHIVEMAKMTRIFYECCVFYNGPLCGASAPDHLHFQAFDVYNMENVMIAFENGDEIFRSGKSSVIIPPSNMYAPPFIIIKSAKDSELGDIFNRVYDALPPAEPEPMMNIAASKISSGTLFAIFPRRKHRPYCYGHGENELLVSPASAEMLRLFPCVSEKEFKALDEETIQRIYDDVCVTPETFQEIIEKIKA